MDRLHTRRAVARGAIGAGAALAFSRTLVAARHGTALASEGLGLARAEWEEIYGAGEALQTLMAYTEPSHRSPMYVGFDHGEHVAFVELRWDLASQAGGVPQETAGSIVRGLLPADARLEETFYLFATPDGPIALRAQRWTSTSLGTVAGGREAILVVYQEQSSQLNPGSPPSIAVTAAAITVEDSQA